MILVGQYDSPYVRRVAVSLRVLGFAYEHDTRSVFGDFDAMREVNPLGRIPSLVLDGGEVLIDSAAILDWLDQTVGPARALRLPSGGSAARSAFVEGAAANLVVFDVRDRWSVDASSLRSKGKNSPLIGRTLPGRVLLTLAAGRVAYAGAEVAASVSS